MRVIGLTGGIGSGKSTVSAMFRALGAEVIDADQVARQVVEPGTPAVEEISRRFPGVVDAQGRLDRAALASRIFADASERNALEAIVQSPHPGGGAPAGRPARGGGSAGRCSTTRRCLIENAACSATWKEVVLVWAPEDVQRQRLVRPGRPVAGRGRGPAPGPDAARCQARAHATWEVDNGEFAGRHRGPGAEDLGGDPPGRRLKFVSVRWLPQGATLVTGYPGFIAKRLVEHLARQGRERLYALAQPEWVERARDVASRVQGASVEVLSGDVTDLHLGLSGDEVERVTTEVERVYHLAACQPALGAPGGGLADQRRRHAATSSTWPASAARLERFVHFSTCHVSGDRVGVDRRGRARQRSGLPQRLGGDQVPGREGGGCAALSRCRSPSSAPRRWWAIRGPGDRSLRGSLQPGHPPGGEPAGRSPPLPGDGVAPLNVVPVDFVVRAVRYLARDARSAGPDLPPGGPNPMSARRVYELIAERANRRIPRLPFPARAADVVLRLPCSERLTRPQRAAIGYINQLAWFSSAEHPGAAGGYGHRCPPLSTYLDTLIAYVRDDFARRQAAEAET